MSDTLRRFRSHPISTTVGALWATLMLGLTSLVWLGALLRMGKGLPLQHNMPVALAAITVISGWYLNFMTVYHRLRRIDPTAYAWATKDWGFIAFVFSRRGHLYHLNNALAQLDLAPYPPSFRYHVRFTLLLNAILIWGAIAAALGAVAISFVAKHGSH